MRLAVFIGEGLTTDFQPPGAWENVHLFPENNKHPMEQMRFIEDVCINAAGHKSVVLVTHSPYIVDHLNNLMYAAKLSPTKRQEAAEHFLYKNKSAFIQPAQVSAENIEVGGAKSDIFNRSTGRIDWESFSRASNYVGHTWDRVDEIKHTRRGR